MSLTLVLTLPQILVLLCHTVVLPLPRTLVLLLPCTPVPPSASQSSTSLPRTPLLPLPRTPILPPPRTPVLPVPRTLVFPSASHSSPSVADPSPIVFPIGLYQYGF